MVKNTNQKSKKAANSKSAGSAKMGVKQPAADNGFSGPENEMGVTAPDSNKNGDEISPAPTEPEQNVETVNGAPKSSNELNPETAVHAKQSVKSQKKKTAKAVNVENSKTSIDEKGDKNSSQPLSKTKERPKRGQAKQMETVQESIKEVSQPESDTSEPSTKGVKRKSEEEPSDDAGDSETRSLKRQATDENKGKKNIVENVTEESSSTSEKPNDKVPDVITKEQVSEGNAVSDKKEDKIEPMETEESVAVEQKVSETVAQSSKTVKRKADEGAPDIESKTQISQPKKEKQTATRSSKRKATEKNVKNKDVEITSKAVASTIKSQKNKGKGPVSLKTKPSPVVVQKKSSATVKVKTKPEKVLLSIPQIKSISGKVFVIGENDVGQLGFGEEVEVKKRPAMLELPQTVADIAAGGMHSVCLTQNGEVITFGCNDEGALGRVTSNEGEEATPRKVEIPEKIVQISAGDSHTAALTESGQVYLWGNFRSGDGPIGLTADGSKQIKPIKVLTDVKIVKISSGTEHLVCLSDEGVVYTCGCGENGQLGRLSERVCRDGGRKGLSILLQPAAVPIKMTNSLPVLIDDIWAGSYSTFLKTRDTGFIYAFGLNNYNHLGYEGERVGFFPKKVLTFNDRTWLQITGGQHHTLALDDSGMVYSMGRQDYGRLGLGENCGEKSAPTVIPTLEKCTDVSCGNCVSFALTDDGHVYSWGMGTNHQLGHGNDEDAHVPRRIEGNFWTAWKTHKVSGGGQHTLLLACPRTDKGGEKGSS